MESTATMGVVGRNARLAHIRKFVCVPPDRGHVLRLVTVEDPPTVLGEWPKEACADNASTAEDVDQRLREHASTTQNETTANLVWQAENTLVVCSKRLRCKPEIDPAGMDPAQVAQAEALGIVGTQSGLVVQMQRHQEAMMRSYFAAHQTQIGQQHALIGLLGNLLTEAQTNAHRAHLELDKMRSQQRRELDELASELREASGEENPEASARADLLQQITGAFQTALPYIVQAVAQRIATPPATPPAPAAPKASGDQ